MSLEIPAHWQRFRALAWLEGIGACVWVAVFETGQRLYVYREHVAQTTAASFAQEVRRQTPHEEARRIGCSWTHPAVWQPGGVGPLWRSQELYASPVPGSDEGGWDVLSEWLAPRELLQQSGEWKLGRRLQVLPECGRSAEALSAPVPEGKALGEQATLARALVVAVLSRPELLLREREPAEASEEMEDAWFRREFPAAWAKERKERRRR